MIFGLGAAFGWGFADLLAAAVSRRWGSFRTLIIAQLAGVASLALLSVLAGTSQNIPTLTTILSLIGIGMMLALTYVSFYRALELGPLALVSPIAASYAGVVMVLAFLVLDEALSALSLTGAVVTLLGVLLTSTDRRSQSEPESTPIRGVKYAILAMLGFGVSLFLLSRYTKELGWMTPTLLSRIGTAAALVAVFAFQATRSTFPKKRRPVDQRKALILLLVAVSVGLLDSLGTSSYSRGSELGLVSIVAAASATYPLIPILAGVVFFQERLQKHQCLGVVLVILGLLLLALG